MDYKRLIELQDAVRNELRILHEEASTRQSSTESALDALIGLEMAIRDIDGVVSEARAGVRAQVSEIMEETRSTRYKGQSGSVVITKGSEYVDYDATAIETLCISEPELASRLRPFRTVRERKPTLVIRR